MSQTNQPSQTAAPAKPGSSRLRTLAIAGLAIVAVLGLAFAGYTSLNPHAVTYTQQQLVTNTQSLYNTQTQTVTSVSTVVSYQTMTNTQTAAYGYPSCSYYGCSNYPMPGYGYPYPGNYYYYYGYNPCQAPSYNNNTVTCSGYFYQASNGCTLLVIPIVNPYYQESYVYQYYTLHNAPSTQSNWTWVTVTGQIYTGANTSSSGASCPGNYINVTSMS